MDKKVVAMEPACNFGARIEAHGVDKVPEGKGFSSIDQTKGKKERKLDRKFKC